MFDQNLSHRLVAHLAAEFPGSAHVRDAGLAAWELAHFFPSSLEPKDEGVEAAWDAEALRRVAEVRSGRAASRPVDEFIAELRGRSPSSTTSATQK